MKYIIVTILFFAGYSTATAQNRDNLYADIGCNVPGISVTYDRKLVNHFDIGLGANFYDYNDHTYNVRSAVFVDLRPYWTIGRSTLFLPVDVGLGYIGGHSPNVTLSYVNLYTGLALGYYYRISKRGMGPYISVGLDGTTIHVHFIDPLLPPATGDYSIFDAVGVLSLGFKF
jgi:hypothetical protein